MDYLCGDYRIINNRNGGCLRFFPICVVFRKRILAKNLTIGYIFLNFGFKSTNYYLHLTISIKHATSLYVMYTMNINVLDTNIFFLQKLIKLKKSLTEHYYIIILF
ncbi:hypothetical protein ACJX0J_010959 [Zea mays]